MVWKFAAVIAVYSELAGVVDVAAAGELVVGLKAVAEVSAAVV